MYTKKKKKYNSVLRSTVTSMHWTAQMFTIDNKPGVWANTSESSQYSEGSRRAQGQPGLHSKSRPSCPRCQKLKVEWIFLSCSAVQQWKQTTTCRILHKEFQIQKESQVCITHYKRSQLVISVSDGRKQDTSGMGGQWWRKKVSRSLSLIQLTIAHITVAPGKIHTLTHVWFTEG